jgi:hypothetical protein
MAKAKKKAAKSKVKLRATAMSRTKPKPRPKPAPKPEPKPAAKTKSNGKPRSRSVNETDKALFLQSHLPKIASIKGQINDLTADLRNAYKSAKADGFLKADFDTAFELQRPGGELKKKAAIARNLTVARWLGYDLGNQLDLFVEDDQTPAKERAYGEGQTASMTNKAAVPPYDPGSDLHAAYMKGFHDDQERILRGGIAPLQEEAPPVAPKLPVPKRMNRKGKPSQPSKSAVKAAADKAEASAKAKAEGVPQEPPSSGIPVTRAQWHAQQAAARAAAEGTPGTAPDDVEEVTVTETTPAPRVPGAQGLPADVEEITMREDDRRETSLFSKKKPAA